jgi:hypothetical protein
VPHVTSHRKPLLREILVGHSAEAPDPGDPRGHTEVWPHLDPGEESRGHWIGASRSQALLPFRERCSYSFQSTKHHQRP